MKTIIIGGTAAGTSAAVKMQKMAKNPEVIIYEKGDLVSFGACGLPYFVGDFFSDEKEMIAREKAAFEKQGISIKLHHEGIAVDTKNKIVTIKDLATGEVFTDNYDQLMIATGSKVVLPPVKRSDFDNLFHLKTMKDGQGVKKLLENPATKNVTVVGGGFIGVEITEALLHQGKKVRLIQLDDRLMKESLDEEFTELLEAKMKEAGVEVHLNEAVQDFEGDQSVTHVVTNLGEYQTDLVIVAIGVKPANDFLGEEFDTLSNGALIVDDQGRTNVADVWAAGDNATVRNIVSQKDVYLPLATGANKLGRVAGESMAGADTKYPGTLGTSGVKFTTLELASTGINETTAKKLGLNYQTVVINDKNQTSYYPGQKDIRVKLVYDKETKQILGGQIAGENGAALRIDVLAAAIAGKMTTNQLGLLDLMYAPPFARTWDVLNIAGNVAK